MSESKCYDKNENIILYLNIGIQLIYIFARGFIDYMHHKKISIVHRGHKTMIIKNQLIHEQIEKLADTLSKNKLDSNIVIDNSNSISNEIIKK